VYHAAIDAIVGDVSEQVKFEGEHCAGHGRAEYRTESGGDTGDDELPAFYPIEMQRAGQLVCEGTAHLESGAFPPRRPAEEVRGDGGQEYERNHAERDGFPGFLDCFDQKVVSGFDISSCLQVEQGHQIAGDRKEDDNPQMSVPECGHESKRLEKGCTGGAGAHPDCRAYACPLREIQRFCPEFFHAYP